MTPSRPRRQRDAIFVWAMLIGLTVLSYAVSTGTRSLAAWVGGSAVIAIAIAKGWLIGMRYMELDGAMLALRIAYTVWLVIVGVVLLVMFAMA